MTLIEQLKQIPDPRKRKGRKHPLWWILFLSLVGSLCNHWGYRSLATFSHDHQGELSGLVGLPSDTPIPSYSTFRRTFQQLDAQRWVDVFNAWSLRHLPGVAGRWFAIDGKSIKCTSIGGNGQNRDWVSVVSVYGQRDEGIVQLRLLHNKQGSEIEVAKQLVRHLPPELAETVTLDALHAQTDTVQTLAQLKIQYVIGLKANQPTLYQSAQALRTQAPPLSTATETDLTHQRQVQRTAWVYAAPASLAQKWHPLQTLIWVERRGIRNGQPFCEQHCYFSSATFAAQTFLALIRGHWQIENRLHWVKDVTFKEDDPPQRGAHAPVSWAILNSFVITIARRCHYRTIPECQRRLANKVQRVFDLIV